MSKVTQCDRCGGLFSTNTSRQYAELKGIVHQRGEVDQHISVDLCPDCTASTLDVPDMPTYPAIAASRIEEMKDE